MGFEVGTSHKPIPTLYHLSAFCLSFNAYPLLIKKKKKTLYHLSQALRACKGLVMNSDFYWEYIYHWKERYIGDFFYCNENRFLMLFLLHAVQQLMQEFGLFVSLTSGNFSLLIYLFSNQHNELLLFMLFSLSFPKQLKQGSYKELNIRQNLIRNSCLLTRKVMGAQCLRITPL